MIICAGEILADMIGTEKDGKLTFDAKAGGAPFNVACGIKRLGGDVRFLGCVGDDLIGKRLKKFAKNIGFDENYIREDGAKNTTLAFVSLDESGERSFSFYRKNTADIHLPEVEESLLKKADIVHIGSLMLSEKEGQKYAVKLAKRTRAAGVKVSFDVNFRTDIFRDRESAIKIYKEMIALADIVKFSEDEIEIFGENYVKNDCRDKLVCISRGSEGSEWRYGGERNLVPTIKVKVVDTTGAGDAFYAGVLFSLDGKDFKKLSREQLDGAFRFGNVCGAINTQQYGAIDGLPDRATVLAKIEG